MLGCNTEAKTVKELIEILSKLNPETKLFSRYGEDGYEEGVSISQHTMHLNKHTSSLDGPHEIYYSSEEPVKVCTGIIIG